MKKIMRIFCIVLISLISITSAATAEESGSAPEAGGGGGSGVAFSVVETKPQDGENGVNVNGSIWLLFNKNVVNMTIRDNNKANIILQDSDGDKVSMQVTMRDDQIEPEYRREIIVVPTSPLDPGTTYMLIIGSDVQAKNGQSLGKAYAVTFITSGVKPAAQQGSVEKSTPIQPDSILNSSVSGQSIDAGNNSILNNAENVTGEKETGSPSAIGNTSSTLDPATDATDKKDGFGLLIPFLLVILAAGLIAAAIYIKNKGRKQD